MPKKIVWSIYSFYNSEVTENGESALYTLEKKADKIKLNFKGSYEMNVTLIIDQRTLR